MANYTFTGTVDQIFGDAFPDSLQNLTVNNNNDIEMSSLSNTLTAFGNIEITQGIVSPKNNMTDLYLAGVIS